MEFFLISILKYSGMTCALLFNQNLSYYLILPSSLKTFGVQQLIKILFGKYYKQ